MTDFEKQIMSFRLDINIQTDVDDFLSRVYIRVSESETNRKTLLTMFCMMMVFSLMTITQFGAPEFKIDNHIVDSTDNLLETDFWNIVIDSLDYNQNYFNDMAYFLLDEGYVWETFELIEELEAIKEES